MTNVADKAAVDEASSELRCTHCGRRVRETIHTRTSYEVDYYDMHAGQTETVTFRRSEDGPEVVYQRLIAPEFIITCRDCYRDPAVQDEREHRFRPELGAQPEEGAA